MVSAGTCYTHWAVDMRGSVNFEHKVVLGLCFELKITSKTLHFETGFKIRSKQARSKALATLNLCQGSPLLTYLTVHNKKSSTLVSEISLKMACFHVQKQPFLGILLKIQLLIMKMVPKYRSWASALQI